MPPAQPSVPYATIEQVLNPVFLRRRRKDIRELYGDDITVDGKRSSSLSLNWRTWPIA